MMQGAVQELLDRAIRCHRENDLVQAEKLYRQVLERDAYHADALYLLGMIARQRGEFERAIELLRQAMRIAPRTGRFHHELATALFESGRLDEATDVLHQALAADPKLASAYVLLGKVLRKKGRAPEGLDLAQRAVQLDSRLAEGWAEMGAALQQMGQVRESDEPLMRAVALDPNLSQALSDLAYVRRLQNRHDEAISLARRALAINPQAHEPYIHLGNTLHAMGEVEQSIQAFRAALQLAPNVAFAHTCLAISLRESGQRDEALAEFHAALRLEPDNPNAHVGYSYALLAQGDFERGLPEFEWRWRYPGHGQALTRMGGTAWQGERLAGKTILLRCEGGLGDTLQFARYAPLLAEGGAQVVLVAQGPLVKLMSRTPAVAECVGDDAPLPPHDVYCPLMRLPLLTGTRLETIPQPVPYVAADEAKMRAWSARLEPWQDRLKVGLVWAGSADHPTTPRRYCPLACMLPLAQVSGVALFSLQKGPGAEQIKAVGASDWLIDWTADLNDFDDTAALVANLDLVITIDSAVAHLAGAMGRRVWTLLGFNADWRWFLEREDSPWYPTMRLWRQGRRGDWAGLMERIARQLRLDAADRVA